MKRITILSGILLPILIMAEGTPYKTSPLMASWEYVGNHGFTIGYADYLSFAISPSGVPWVSFVDMSTPLDKVVAMKYNGTEWIVVGAFGFSPPEADETCIAVGTDELPYVVFTTYSDSDKVSVMKYNGTEWAYVGPRAFSPGVAGHPFIATDPTGIPYIAFADCVDPGSCKASVMKFDGTNWVFVGSEGFTSSEIYYSSLAFSPLGEVYLAYETYRPINVMKFDGSDWVNVGGEVSGQTTIPSIAIGPTGIPYVAFADEDASRKATVVKFDGSNWVPVGPVGFTPGATGFECIRISTGGQLFVGFNDYSVGKVSVMTFTGESWAYVGEPGISEGGSGGGNMDISNAGELYYAFRDADYDGKASAEKFDSVFLGTISHRVSSFSVFPNPATNRIVLSIPQGTNTSRIIILDPEGREIMHTTSDTPQTSIDISMLPPGIWFAEVITGQTVSVVKFIKM